MKKEREKYVFKINKNDNGRKYLQIWEWNEITGKYEYVLSAGTAEKTYKKLVKLRKLQNQTKNYSDFVTKN